jgi:predicted RNA binding protein YcfA (HicA-like mRNA interferase family)
MPKFPGLSGNDIVKALQKLGFTVARQAGSHISMKGEGYGCVVPNHKEVKLGTINRIPRQANVSPDEFQKFI